jgi:5,5'-dehydrodivanillate O-demethylase oxygenase subunit
METKDHEGVRRERLALLAPTAAETLMGRLLRSFWQPVALADSVPAGKARPLRILNEDYTLFRGADGVPCLIGARCAHRRALLHTGWVEGGTIRCMYHGWRYDGTTGACVEMPGEKQLRPESVSAGAHPVREYGGLLFAYLGDGSAPEFDLPRKHIIEKPGMRWVNQEVLWDCNWFQQIENSLDGSHLAYAHQWGAMSRFAEDITTEMPALSYEETSAGLWQTATRSNGNIRISDWTFPNNNHVKEPGPRKGDPWIDTFVWAVPVDDVLTKRFFIYAYPDTDADKNARIVADRSDDFDFIANSQALIERQELPLGKTNLLQAQDYVAVRSQGAIMDRASERLGQTDTGIAILRRVFLRELDALRDGKPMKSWTRIARPFELPMSVPQPAGV